MENSFGKNSSRHIASAEGLQTLDRPTTEHLIDTIRKLVLYDKDIENIHESSNTLDDDLSWDIDIVRNGAHSDHGKIELKVYNDDAIDNEEDPDSTIASQTVEVIYGGGIVFKATAFKKPTKDFIYADDLESDAPLSRFRIQTFEKGPWLLAILNRGSERKVKEAPGANDLKVKQFS